MKAYELLSSPEKWTQGAYAKTAANVVCNPLDAVAVCWCVSGAIFKCYTNDEDAWEAQRQRHKLEVYLRDVKGSATYPQYWNDRTTYEEVYAALKACDI